MYHFSKASKVCQPSRANSRVIYLKFLQKIRSDKSKTFNTLREIKLWKSLNPISQKELSLVLCLNQIKHQGRSGAFSTVEFSKWKTLFSWKPPLASLSLVYSIMFTMKTFLWILSCRDCEGEKGYSERMKKIHQIVNFIRYWNIFMAFEVDKSPLRIATYEFYYPIFFWCQNG